MRCPIRCAELVFGAKIAAYLFTHMRLATCLRSNPAADLVALQVKGMGVGQKQSK